MLLWVVSIVACGDTWADMSYYLWQIGMQVDGLRGLLLRYVVTCVLGWGRLRLVDSGFGENYV